jgi:hypothetical protein
VPVVQRKGLILMEMHCPGVCDVVLWVIQKTCRSPDGRFDAYLKAKYDAFQVK